MRRTAKRLASIQATNSGRGSAGTSAKCRDGRPKCHRALPQAQIFSDCEERPEVKCHAKEFPKKRDDKVCVILGRSKGYGIETQPFRCRRRESNDGSKKRIFPLMFRNVQLGNKKGGKDGLLWDNQVRAGVPRERVCQTVLYSRAVDHSEMIVLQSKNKTRETTNGKFSFQQRHKGTVVSDNNEVTVSTDVAVELFYAKYHSK
ncbi:hypothetical protein BV898_09923 [Hypsibius exemplaris]|uniref:Uncharacterized protein n=1 Tax=Hypsibius exemplaris TaxID=2072580 RepID=A0A1W0WLK5_HYPEX|nr:hypothetical protein BV898_09923 [Hypsibius exemplaris]